ncbi:MAG: OmpA family protein [Pseudomonadota bacterium]
MNTLTRVLLAGNLILLTALVALFGYRMWQSEDQRQLERYSDRSTERSELVMTMLSGLEDRLERYRSESIQQNADGDQALSPEALRETIRRSIEEALAEHESARVADAQEAAAPQLNRNALAPPSPPMPLASTAPPERDDLLPREDILRQSNAGASVRPALAMSSVKTIASSPAITPIDPMTAPLAPGQKRRLVEVHFSHGSSSMSPGALKKTREAIEALSKVDHKKIRIVGFTDTTGNPDANMVLSERRAGTVAEMLIEYGIAPERIEIIGRGEAPGPMPTGDGVDEPLNRCVGIFAVN